MSNYKRISVGQAETILHSQDNVLLLDMREARDFACTHHPRAIHLGSDILRSILKNRKKDTHLLVYCYHGNSSRDIATLFADFGFTNSYSVDGGFEAWHELMAMQNSRWSLAANAG
jgi:rhodanese-related sulfurtransferase